MTVDLSKYTFFKEAKDPDIELLPAQGYSNKNHRFSYQNKNYLLRQFILQDRDREQEFKIQSLAYEQGIAAQPLVLDMDENMMICEFLEGEHKEVLERDTIQNIVSVLKKLHRIEIEQGPLNLPSLFTDASQEVKNAFNIISDCPKQTVLCHNDLNPKNILFENGTVKFIDWEFAGNNDLYFDLAALSIEFNLSVIDEAYMLAFYFQREGWDKEKLEAYKIIYKDLCKQWFKENTGVRTHAP